MLWGSRADVVSPGVLLALATQVAVFVVLVGPVLRGIAPRLSPFSLTAAGAAAITGSTAVFQALFPLVRVGMTSGLLTIFGTFPLTLLNTVVFAVRATRHQGMVRGGGLPFVVVPLNLAYWAWLVVPPALS
jgi:hypothetical protein